MVTYDITYNPKQKIYGKEIPLTIWHRRKLNELQDFCLKAYARSKDIAYLDMYEWCRKQDQELKKDFEKYRQ